MERIFYRHSRQAQFLILSVSLALPGLMASRATWAQGDSSDSGAPTAADEKAMQDIEDEARGDLRRRQEEEQRKKQQEEEQRRKQREEEESRRYQRRSGPPSPEKPQEEAADNDESPRPTVSNNEEKPSQREERSPRIKVEVNLGSDERAGERASVRRHNLSGIWKDDRGVCYRFRQIGDQVYWSMDDIPNSYNILSGTVDGNQLNGEWVDVPGGATSTPNRELRISIESGNRLVKISPSEYGSKRWSRWNSSYAQCRNGRKSTPVASAPAQQPYDASVNLFQLCLRDKMNIGTLTVKFLQANCNHTAGWQEELERANRYCAQQGTDYVVTGWQVKKKPSSKRDIKLHAPITTNGEEWASVNARIRVPTLPSWQVVPVCGPQPSYDND